VFRLRISTVLLLITLGAAPAAAQGTAKNELTVFGGVSIADVSTQRQEGFGFLRRSKPDPRELSLLPFVRTSSSLDGSPEFGVRYGRALSDALVVEGDFSIAPGHDLTEIVEYGCPDGYACLANRDGLGVGTLLFVPDRLTTARMVAYHYGGGIRLRRAWGSLTPSVSGGLGGLTYSGDRQSETQLAVRIGGALSAAGGSHNTTFEVLDVIVPDHFVTNRAAHDVHVRIGLGVRW
jgi:hypothetical protein